MDGAAERRARAGHVLIGPEQSEQRVAAMESGSTGASGRGGGEISQERQSLGLREDRPELAVIRTAQIQCAEGAKLYQTGSRWGQWAALTCEGRVRGEAAGNFTIL